MFKILSILLVFIFIVGCGASPSNTDEALASRTALPYRDASMMDGSTSKYKISVAVTAVSEELQERYFSDSVLDKGVIPLMLTITNNAKQDVLVESLDISIIKGSTEIKQTDVDMLKKKMRDSIMTLPGINEPVPSVDNRYLMRVSALNNIFFNKTIREGIVHSGESLTGFIFFDKLTYPVGDKKLRVYFQTLRKINYFSIDANFNF